AASTGLFGAKLEIRAGLERHGNGGASPGNQTHSRARHRKARVPRRAELRSQSVPLNRSVDVYACSARAAVPAGRFPEASGGCILESVRSAWALHKPLNWVGYSRR